MKKLTIFLIVLSTIATAQLRVGVDAKRTMDMKVKMMGVSASESMDADGMGLTFGYEKMLLLGLIGAGAEYNLSLGGDDDDEDGGPSNMGFVYGVAKVPVGLPMARGIVRLGTSFGHEEGVKGALSYGVGLRVKPPIFPIGIEALYTIHNLDMDMELDDADEGTADALGLDVETSFKYFNITATYSF